jgi:hypothetical protein
MATSWKSQQSNGEYALQFETDSKEKYRLVEKAAMMAVSGKTAADYAPVVRCKDCKYRNPYGYRCRRDNLWHDSDDFCSYGERK